MNHIEIRHGNLLRAEAEVLVNTVNCVGVRGKGIALQFQRAFPEISKPYKDACAAGLMHPGELLPISVQPTLDRPLPLTVVNFATKDHWRGKSKIQWIEAGLASLALLSAANHWKSIAIPPLGCGNGGLDWGQVLPLIELAFAGAVDTRVLVYPPEGAPDAADMAVSGKVPNMTTNAALTVHMLARYSVVDLEFSQLELQKLTYFLQEAGEPLHLNFEAMKYGPAAPEIFPMLRRWEGHWTIGFGDGTGGLREPIMLRPEIVQAGADFLKKQPSPASEARVQQVLQLIEGMDTAAGLELLATVHWVARHTPGATVDWRIAAKAVHDWNEHKRTAFPDAWIQKAWQRLHDRQMMPVNTRPSAD